LIDFSDILETNVFILGHTFLAFCHCLNIQLPVIDPSLYIQVIQILLGTTTLNGDSFCSRNLREHWGLEIRRILL
jgi:hypothetical protein